MIFFGFLGSRRLEKHGVLLFLAVFYKFEFDDVVFLLV